MKRFSVLFVLLTLSTLQNAQCSIIDTIKELIQEVQQEQASLTQQIDKGRADINAAELKIVEALNSSNSTLEKELNEFYIYVYEAIAYAAQLRKDIFDCLQKERVGVTILKISESSFSFCNPTTDLNISVNYVENMKMARDKLNKTVPHCVITNLSNEEGLKQCVHEDIANVKIEVVKFNTELNKQLELMGSKATVCSRNIFEKMEELLFTVHTIFVDCVKNIFVTDL